MSFREKVGFQLIGEWAMQAGSEVSVEAKSTNSIKIATILLRQDDF
ncbi:hypothetical protein [Paenibacillus sp. J2TS4]|nr:hypothetical protein [Paenibacillus sp. J2TS4]GIP31575.1 hypothetical protein J2TS4_07850 [Paenibacillus sp. J2TS4]